MGGKAYDFSVANTVCVGAPDIKTAVVFLGVSDVPSLSAVGCIRLTVVRGFMDDCEDSGGGQGGYINVMGPLEVCIG